MKVLLHLRSTINDDTLGLFKPNYDEEMPGEKLPDERNPFDIGERPDPPKPIRPEGPKSSPPQLPGPSLDRKDSGADTPDDLEVVKNAFDRLPLQSLHGDSRFHVVHPADSDRIYVDVFTYNGRAFYVQGDVAAPGKMPWTGHETVLDAMQYAGGFLPFADQKNIRLVRPARGGKPAKVYPIDYAAILYQGDAKANLQVFPGDRLIVGRNAVVRQTIEIDRLAAPIQTVVNSMAQFSVMRRVLDTAAPHLQPADRDALLKAWFEFWSKAASRPDGVMLDEKTFREALERALKPPTSKAPREVENK